MGGLTLYVWLRLYQRCHNFTQTGPSQWAWPDGGSILEQPALAVEMFSMITEMVLLELKQP